jgi:hypothetical protein
VVDTNESVTDGRNDDSNGASHDEVSKKLHIIVLAVESFIVHACSKAYTQPCICDHSIQ